MYIKKYLLEDFNLLNKFQYIEELILNFWSKNILVKKKNKLASARTMMVHTSVHPKKGDASVCRGNRMVH